MEVTIDNFEDALAKLQTYLPSSLFVSFDLEMTGLEISKYFKHRSSPLDTIQQRYQKALLSVENFMVLQFGLCLWNKETRTVSKKLKAPEEHEHEHDQGQDQEQTQESATDAQQQQESTETETVIVCRPFNFYIFPASDSSSNYSFMCQTSSLRFLVAECHFDFNKTIREGIPFMSGEDEERIRSRRFEPKKPPTTQQIVISKPSDKIFLDTIIEQVRVWSENKSNTFLDLQPCNAYLRRIIYQEIPQRFPEVTLTSEQGDRTKFIRVSRMTEEQKEKLREDYIREAEQKFEKAIGFRRVFKMLVAHRKAIVAHNSLLDFAHVFHKFHKKLPPQVEAFSRELKLIFPLIVDTKQLASSAMFESYFASRTALGDLFSRVQQKPFAPYMTPIVFGEGFERYSQEEDKKDYGHEAGYDAYMTGYIFQALGNFILQNNAAVSAASKILPTATATATASAAATESVGANNNNNNKNKKNSAAASTNVSGDGESKEDDASATTKTTDHDALIFSPENPAHLSLISEHINKIHMMNSDACINLDGPNEMQDRSTVFYVYGFDPKQTTDDLVKYFARYGDVRVIWADDQSAFVRIMDRTKALACTRELCRATISPAAAAAAAAVAYADGGNDNSNNDMADIITSDSSTGRYNVITYAQFERLTSLPPLATTSTGMPLIIPSSLSSSSSSAAVAVAALRPRSSSISANASSSSSTSATTTTPAPAPASKKRTLASISATNDAVSSSSSSSSSTSAIPRRATSSSSSSMTPMKKKKTIHHHNNSTTFSTDEEEENKSICALM